MKNHIQAIQELKKIKPVIASANEISNLEQGLGIKIPGDLKESLQLQNGEGDDKQSLLGGYRNLYSCEQILNVFNDMVRFAEDMNGLDEQMEDIRHDNKVQPYLWSKGWVPFLFENDLIYVIDLMPSQHGTKGQIVVVDIEDSRVDWVAPSYRKLIEATIEIETNKLKENNDKAQWLLDNDKYEEEHFIDMVRKYLKR